MSRYGLILLSVHDYKNVLGVYKIINKYLIHYFFSNIYYKQRHSDEAVAKTTIACLFMRMEVLYMT
jgi:hypothetical protein